MATARIVLVLVICLVSSGAPVEPGACCLSNGDCFILDGVICDTVPGSFWAGAGTDCFDRDGGGSPDACFPTREKMFWVLDGTYRSNHDGTNVEKLLLHDASNLSVDADHGNLYWLDLDADQIIRSDFDGSNSQAFITGVYGSLSSMKLDLAGRNIYFSTFVSSYLFPLDIPEELLPVPLASGRQFDMGGGRVWDWTIIRPSACDGMKMDANGDGRIDLRDYAAFQRCLSNGD